MKLLICYIAFLSGFVSHSQNPVNFSIYSNSIKPYTFNIGIASKNIYKSTYTLSVYNPMIQLNDNYTRVGENYYTTDVKSFPLYSFNGILINSLNPYGSATMEEVLLSGVLGTFGIGTLTFSPPPLALPKQ
ncbi:MAG: hypothetical protein ACI7YS_12550 [Flavobacterium sp.]